MESNNFNSSTEYIVKSIEQNYSDFYIEMAKLKGCEYRKSNCYNWVRGNEGRWPTGIFDIRLQIDSINNTINDMVTRMKVGLLPNTIMTGPSSIPDNYERYFNEFGLIRKYEAAGMAMNILDTKLEYLNDDNDLEICILEDEELIFNWCKIVCVELFSKPDKKSIEDFCDLIRLTFPIDKFRCFVATYKDRIIATSFLYLNKGVAGIYFVATDKAYRNKGVGKLITLAPLIFAQKRGYRLGILQASPLGEAIYKKIGFKEYCRLGRYKLD